MRILILGGDAMLGHQLFLRLGKKYDVKRPYGKILSHMKSLAFLNEIMLMPG